MQTISELIKLLTLQKIGDHQYLGESHRTMWKRVFGGQVLGQSLHAAYQTVPEDRFAHSMHGYFILPGDIEEPITYQVDPIRDGGSITTRRVAAIQKEKVIFIMAASFQLAQEGFDHQISAPNVLPPDVLLPDYEQIRHIETINPQLYQRLANIRPRAIEFRPVENLDPINAKSRGPYRHIWMKANGEMTVDLRMQHQLLAYASDYNLLTTALLPHQEGLTPKDVFLASIDHAIWFHRDFTIGNWLLYATDSPSASNSRGFSRGNIFDLEGRLVASVVQEGLIRRRKEA